MIKSVVREFHYPPAVIDNLYLDSADHHGLEFWFEDVREVVQKIENPLPKK